MYLETAVGNRRGLLEGQGKCFGGEGSIVADGLNFSCNPTTIVAHHVSPEYKNSSKQF